MGDTKIFEAGERYPREIMDFPKLVTMQIGVCQEYLTRSDKEFQIGICRSAIDVFEAMITSTCFGEACHKAYEKDMEKLEKEHNKFVKKKTKQEQRVERVKLEKFFLLEKWKNLLILGKKMGFTYIGKKVVTI